MQQKGYAQSSDLMDSLLAEIEALPGVKIVTKKSYRRVVAGTTTCAYVSGQRKLRVDVPGPDGYTAYSVTSARAFKKVIKAMSAVRERKS